MISQKPTYEELEQRVQELENAEAERKLAEHALHESEAHYHSIFANSLIGITVTDRSFIFTDVNDAICKMLEYSKEEIVGRMTISDISHPDDVEKSMDMVNKLMRHEIDHYIIEKRYISKTGETVPVLVYVRGNYGPKGEYEGTTAFNLDMTERKKADELLRTNEEKYQQVTNQIPGMLFQFILHKDGTYSVPYVSDKVFEYSGFRPEQVMAEPSLLFQPIHHNDIDYIQEQIRLSAENLSEFMVEHRLITPSGEIKWFKVKSTPTLLERGSILWNSISIDITEQKIAEEQIQKKDEMLTIIHQNAPVGMGVVDTERRFHWPNPKLAQITGYSLAELEVMQIRKLYASEKEYVRVGDQQTRNLTGNNFSEIETKWKRRDGKTVNVVLNTAYKNPKDPAQGIIETALDITRRTHAENDLKIHLAKLDAIFNSTPNILLLVNNEGRVESINHKGIEFSGRNEEELIGRAKIQIV